MRAAWVKAALAAALAAAAGGLAAPVAAAGPVKLDDGPFTLRGAGPTAWDSAVAQPGCEASSAYTPVQYGLTAEAHRLRGYLFRAGAMFHFDGADFDALGGNGFYNPKTRTLNVGPAKLFDIFVSRQETARGPWLRSLVKLRNPEPTPHSGFAFWESRLTGPMPPLRTSSGDAALAPGDRWAIPAVPPQDSDEWYELQQAALVFAGRGAAVRVDSVPSDPAVSGCFSVGFSLALPPNSTRYLLFFTEQHTTRAATLRGVQKFNRRRLSKPLLAGIPRKVRKRILNWKL